MKNYSTKNVTLDNARGKLEFRLTNDYLFRAVFQTNDKALKGLLCSLLHLDASTVKKIEILNPVELGRALNNKEFRLDIKIRLNSRQTINLEMQVENLGNWEQRSLSYTCRMFDSLNKGLGYDNARPVMNIGILDFTLKTDAPEFYSTYKILNEDSGLPFSDDLTIKILDITKINLATDQDREYNIDTWARLFKADTWEMVKALAKENSYIEEAAKSMFLLDQDEEIREQMIQRQEFYADQRAFRRQLRNSKKLIAKQSKSLDEKDKLLAEKDKFLAEKDEFLAEKDKSLAEKDREIAALKAELAKVNA